MPVSHTALVVDHRVGGVDASYLPSLPSGQNLNLAANDKADLRRQGNRSQ